MINKKNKRELSIDFMENFMNEGTSQDENKVWVSEESLIQWLENKIIKPKVECQSSRRQMDAMIEREAFKIILKELKSLK